MWENYFLWKVCFPKKTHICSLCTYSLRFFGWYFPDTLTQPHFLSFLHQIIVHSGCPTQINMMSNKSGRHQLYQTICMICYVNWLKKFSNYTQQLDCVWWHPDMIFNIYLLVAKITPIKNWPTFFGWCDPDTQMVW